MAVQRQQPLAPAARALLLLLAFAAVAVGTQVSVSLDSASPIGTCTVDLQHATCYVDDTTGRHINRPLGLPTATAPHSQGMTQQQCAQQCQNTGKKLAGVEFGWQCYCGNALNYAPKVSKACTTPCPGTGSEACGGADAMLVFAVNCSGPTPPPTPPPSPPPPPPQPPVQFDWLDPCNLEGVPLVDRRAVGFGWCNYTATPVARATALVQAMTLDEKARTIQPFAPPIGRLRLPPLWTTDALHGAFSSPHYTNCTVFPQAVANAASFDRSYMHRMVGHTHCYAAA